VSPKHSPTDPAISRFAADRQTKRVALPRRGHLLNLFQRVIVPHEDIHVGRISPSKPIRPLLKEETPPLGNGWVVVLKQTHKSVLPVEVAFPPPPGPLDDASAVIFLPRWNPIQAVDSCQPDQSAQLSTRDSSDGKPFHISGIGHPPSAL